MIELLGINAAQGRRRRVADQREVCNCRRTQAVDLMRLIKTFRNTPRKWRDSTRTGMMKSGQHGTQRDRSCETAARHNHVHVGLVAPTPTIP